MSEAEESPAQKQARIRRERREAKIKAGGNDRLDKITKLSGRNPENMQNESLSPSPASRSPATRPMSAPTPPPQPSLSNAEDPSQIQAQQDFLRQMLRSQAPAQESDAEQSEDPMVKMIQQMLGGGDPSDPNAPEMPSFSPDDISKATGIPSFVTNMFLGKQPETLEQKRQATMWKIMHVLFAIMVGLYTTWTITTAITSFGASPPAPATFRNPFLVFVMGEVLVEGARTASRGMGNTKGIGAWYQLAKDIGRDGGIVIFCLGMSLWWRS